MKISLYKSQKHASFGLKPNPNLKRAQEAQSKPQACIGREHLLLNTTFLLPMSYVGFTSTKIRKIINHRDLNPSILHEI